MRTRTIVLLIVAFLIAVFGTLVGVSMYRGKSSRWSQLTDYERERIKHGPFQEVTLDELRHAFDRDPDDARRDYSITTLRLSAQMGERTRWDEDTWFITLTDGSYSNSVAAIYDGSDDLLEQTAYRDRVTLHCEGAGLFRGSVVLKDCVLERTK